MEKRCVSFLAGMTVPNHSVWSIPRCGSPMSRSLLTGRDYTDPDELPSNESRVTFHSLNRVSLVNM